MAIAMYKFLVIALIAVLALWVVVQQGNSNKAFITGAKKISGSVVHKEERLPRPDQASRKENWLVYSYTVAGTPYTGQEKVEFGDLWGNLAEGQTIEIYYSGDKPQVSHPVMIMDRRVGIIGKLTY